MPKADYLVRVPNSSREKIERLAKLLSDELGVPVTKPHAIAKAIDEALAARAAHSTSRKRSSK